MLGSTYDYQDVGQYFSARGRFLSDSDNDTRRRVAVIGEQVRQDLALPEDPVGEYIQINGEWLKIIGLLEAKGEIFGQSQDNRVMIPYNTMVALQGRRTQPDISWSSSPSQPRRSRQRASTITRLAAHAHKLKTDDEDDFRIQTAQQLQDTFNSILTTVTIVMTSIVSISLLVGGIGIMNIMLVSVTERTREIGICKAIGAKRHHILLQFLLEALVLCLLGGIVGLVIGYGTRRARGVVDSGLPARPHALVGHRTRDWILGRRRRRLRHLARREGGELGPDQLAALRVARPLSAQPPVRVGTPSPPRLRLGRP